MDKYLKHIEQFWLSYFYTRPANLWALRISISAFLGLLIFAIFGKPLLGLTVGMGVVAAALTEDDIHARSVIRSAPIITFVFFVSSALVSLLFPYKIVFGVFLVLATFLISLLGAYRSSYLKLSFGLILILLYAVFVYSAQVKWYLNPILFALGALIYMSTTFFMLLLSPFRNIKNEIANAYRLLAKYLKIKAAFFPSTNDEQEELRNELALINIKLFSQTENIKNHFKRFVKFGSANQKQQLRMYINEWNQLQKLHERAVSSHESYDLISKESKQPLLVEGFGKMLKELAQAAEQYADCILNKEQYKHPNSVRWTHDTLKILVKKRQKQSEKSYIGFLYDNISSMDSILSAPTRESSTTITPEANETSSFAQLFNAQHSRFRHSVRLSFCFFVGYLLMNLLDIEQGAWIILTSFIVCQQTYDATRQRFFQRISGTLFGVVWGVILAYLAPTISGQTLILLLSIYLFFKYLKSNYIISVIFITVYVLEVYDLLNGSGVQMMLPRIINTIIGAVLAYLSIHFIFPEWQYKNLKPLLSQAVIKNKRYFESVMNPDISDEEYLHNQRSAHRADNQLTQVWKSMRIEPASKRKLLTASRNFTYLNHSLLSYISAFGAHRKSLSFDTNDFEQREMIRSILIQINDFINQNKELNLSQNTKIDELKSNNSLFLKNILNASIELREAASFIDFSDF